MHAPCFFCWVSRQDLLFSLIYRPNWIRHCLISSHLLGTQSVGNIYLILWRNYSINKNSWILETFSCSKKMREKLPIEPTFLQFRCSGFGTQIQRRSLIIEKNYIFRQFLYYCIEIVIYLLIIIVCFEEVKRYHISHIWFQELGSEGLACLLLTALIST